MSTTTIRKGISVGQQWNTELAAHTPRMKGYQAALAEAKRRLEHTDLKDKNRAILSAFVGQADTPRPTRPAVKKPAAAPKAQVKHTIATATGAKRVKKADVEAIRKEAAAAAAEATQQIDKATAWKMAAAHAEALCGGTGKGSGFLVAAKVTMGQIMRGEPTVLLGQ